MSGAQAVRWNAPMDLARAVRRRSSLVDRMATRGETEMLLVRHDPVLVLSMGKTGTSSLEASIADVTGRPVLKAHALTRTGIARRHARERHLGHGVRPRFLWRTEQIRVDLLVRRSHPWDVVSAIREPVARAASAYFYGEQLRAYRRDDTSDDAPIEQHVAGVLEILDNITNDEDWFRDEFEPVTGIDVYASPFPHDEGAAELTSGRFRALLLRHEDLGDVAQGALGRFFGQDWPPLERRNEGRSDNQASAYARFLAAPHLPADAVDRAYACRLARHFYREEELARFRTRWVA